MKKFTLKALKSFSLEDFKNLPKKTKNIIYISGGALLILILVLVFVLSFNGSGPFNQKSSLKAIKNEYKDIDTEKFTVAENRDELPIVYVKDGALYAKAADGSGEAVNLSGDIYKSGIVDRSHNYHKLAFQSKDRKVTYFIKDFVPEKYTGSLYATTDYTTSVLVDENVIVEYEYDYLKLSDDGKTALYMKNLTVEDEEVYADLYVKNIDTGESVCVSENLYAMQTDFFISPNGEYVASYSNYNPETKKGGLIIYKLKENSKALVLDNVKNFRIHTIANDGSLIYTAAETDAMGTTLKNSVNVIKYDDMKIVSYGKYVAPSGVYVSEKGSSKFVYIEGAGEYLAYSVSSGKEPEVISDKFLGFTNIDVENEYYIFAQANEEGKALYPTYLKTPELSEPVYLADVKSPADIWRSVDYKIFYYISEGTLYTREFKKGKLTEPGKIAENVDNIACAQSGNAVVFEADINEENETSSLKCYTKKSKKVSDIITNAKLDSYRLSADGTCVMYTTEFSQQDFTSKLNIYNIYNKGDNNYTLKDNVSLMPYFFDQYQSSLTETKLSVRNKFYQRASNTVLYYKDPDANCNASLYLFDSGKNTLIADNVITVLFE